MLVSIGMGGNHIRFDVVPSSWKQRCFNGNLLRIFMSRDSMACDIRVMVCKDEGLYS